MKLLSSLSRIFQTIIDFFAGGCRVLPFAAASVLSAMLLPGCTRRIYVPVERESTRVILDTVLLATARFDSASRLDSVVIERRGDTVYHTAWRNRYRLQRVVDTLVRVRHDTVLVRTAAVIPDASVAKGSQKGLWWLVAASVLMVGAIYLIKSRRS